MAPYCAAAADIAAGLAVVVRTVAAAVVAAAVVAAAVDAAGLVAAALAGYGHSLS